MSADNIIGLVLSLVIAAYLIMTLVAPERF
jgi:hypothetical protein